MKELVIVWLVILVASVVLEVATVGLISIWMAGGALVALIAALLGAPLWLQVVLFFAVTFALLFFTRPWAKKYLNSRKQNTNLNGEPIGKEVKVIEEVNNKNETGKVLHHGIEWTARSADPEVTFAVDESAVVSSVDGVKLILKKIETGV